MVEINLTEVENKIYLKVLKEFKNSPTHLYYRGILPLKRIPSVAIIGTRRPTHYGKQVTYDLAYTLAKQGVVIISGLALGVDAIAHRAALDAGGKTIAILASGLDAISPRTNARLAQEILVKGGALISEYPPGTQAKPYQFLARNRLVSGLADVVVVTEAAARSGTFSTVTHALDQGKEVFAVPGNITSILSVGPNQLIKQGATPALDSTDILEVLDVSIGKQISLPLRSPIEQKILELVKAGTADASELQTKSELNPSEFLSTLTLLEIEGAIRNLGGDKWVAI